MGSLQESLFNTIGEVTSFNTKYGQIPILKVKSTLAASPSAPSWTTLFSFLGVYDTPVDRVFMSTMDIHKYATALGYIQDEYGFFMIENLSHKPRGREIREWLLGCFETSLELDEKNYLMYYSTSLYLANVVTEQEVSKMYTDDILTSADEKSSKGKSLICFRK